MAAKARVSRGGLHRNGDLEINYSTIYLVWLLQIISHQYHHGSDKPAGYGYLNRIDRYIDGTTVYPSPVTDWVRMMMTNTTTRRDGMGEEESDLMWWDVSFPCIRKEDSYRN